jgi:hypothetical protein
VTVKIESREGAETGPIRQYRGGLRHPEPMTTDWADEGSINERDDWTDERDDCTDEQGGFTDEQADWLDRWSPPCPMRNPQRVCRCLAYREREPGRLQLRVPVWVGTEGICAALVEEDEDNVYVRVIMCYEEFDSEDDECEELGTKADECWDCPVHVYLEKPLNGRTVIEVKTHRVLPLFVPDWKEGSSGPENP